MKNSTKANTTGHVLTIELVPSTCWYSNLRNAVSPAAWDAIRLATYAGSGHVCAICSASGVLHCHERWHYDDVQHVQRLDGFIALCRLCHSVKHIGYAEMFSDDYDGVVRHYLKVNGCSMDDFVVAKALAFGVWRERSCFDWVQDFGAYTPTVMASDSEGVGGPLKARHEHGFAKGGESWMNVVK